MIQVTIFLKSGASFDVLVKAFIVRISKSGRIVGFEWWGIKEYVPQLRHIDFRKISAIASMLIE